MQFRVTGTNHATGARMTLELEAPAKAAAENKARAAGMDVQHVEAMSANPEERHGSRHRGEDVTGVHPLFKGLIVFLLIVAACYLLWPWISGLFGRG